MSGLQTEILGSVSRETLDELRRFATLVEAYTAHTNIIAASTVPDIWNRHVLDSAQLLKLKPEARRWLDLGSGGGFPGIVTAILLKHVAGAHVDLVESTGKKAAFLQSVVAELRLPSQVWNRRVEDGNLPIEPPEIISARAFAPLPRLFGWASPWLSRGAVGLFHKGKNFAGEVQESRSDWDFHMLKHPSLMDSEAAILEIAGLRRK